MTTTHAITEPTVLAPYRIGPDTWVVPELVPAEPGTVLPMNSMVITGAEPVIVDTGNELSRDAWLEAVFSIVEPDDVRWVFLSHDDHDHIGNLLPVLDACPDATLVTNWFTLERTSRALALPLERMRWVNPGESFDAGDRTLVAVRPPVFDSPTTRGLLDTSTSIYWAVDTFATLMPGDLHDAADIPDDLWAESVLFLARMVGAWHTLVDPAKWNRVVDDVARLGITTVASGHSAPLGGARLAAAFELIRSLPTLDAAPLPGQSDLDALLVARRPAAA